MLLFKAKVEHKKYMKKVIGGICILLAVVAVIVVCVKLLWNLKCYLNH